MPDYISVKLAKNQGDLYLISMPENRSVLFFVLFAHNLVYIVLAHISTMKCTYMFNNFLEYNNVSSIHLNGLNNCIRAVV